MRPAFLDEMSWSMAEVYGAVTDRILINLARYFPYVKPGEELPGAFEYQARMLAKMGQVNRDTADIIMKSLDGADAALRGALETAIMDALKNEEPKLRKAAEQGLLGSFIPPEVAPGQMQAFKSYYAQSADKLNLVNTVMLESTQAAYTATVSDVVNRIQNTQAILNTGAGEVITGVSSWNTAMRDAVRKMVDNGLTGFIDHGGHRWSPEAYVAMDIRTTMFNTSRAAINERAQEYGCDLYQVSSHNGARPLCYPWQGKVISRSGWTGTVEDLDGNKVTVHSESEIESFRYGGGLFGVNCGHYPMNFIPGVSTIKGEPQDPEENEKTYAESQQQRALERKLRAERRDLEVMKAQGADEQAIKAQRDKVRKASADIDQFCEDTGRARRRNREYAPANAKFPPKDSYNPAEFPTEQRDRINDWFRNGGDNPPPQPTNIHLGPDNIPPQGQTQVAIPGPVKSEFTPAKTIEEAEKFAESFTDTSRWGAVGVSYKGVSVDVANEVNETLSTFYNTYKVDKFGGVVAPAGNTKLGKMVGDATAGYMPMRHSIVLNRATLKNMAIAEKGFAEEQSILDRYFANPQGWKFKTERAKRVVEASRLSGRATVPKNVKEAIWHELGHSLEKPLRGVTNYGKIKEGFNVWAEKVSGYATADFDEYIAESFCAWNKGEAIDPELIAGFKSLWR
jgi:hypothetical protein